ncbi:polysaccharide deacetylase [Photobacterium sanctipauli]|uniref:Polysaccharide deacetylase n=1 Tax=Photobacterium sanctipauli TaxID=1342794 RepID=A0A2T3N971_9GAMM|nr:polysaccharide deacetylase family protein [Photobacterium sanctipauli]PSW09986.1 polysaccharide deacetylase [Photobacterium sanctipauli]
MSLLSRIALPSVLSGIVFSASIHAQSANILLYHHIADDTPHSTSTTTAQFAEQLDHFEEQGYKIIGLEEMVHRIQTGEALNEKSLALTFDDGFVSVCENAYPELKRRGLPFTVFVSTAPVDKGYTGYCNWQQLKEMSKNGATIANHTTDHGYLVRSSLNDAHWLQNAKDSINKAQQRIKEEIGTAPMLFAYPYGEYNNELKHWVSEQGYIAFGQQSGSIGLNSDWQALPRYNAAGNYGSVNSLRHKINAHPLPLNYSELPDPVTQQRQPTMTVNLLPSKDAYYPHLRCYINGQALEPNWLSDTSFSVIPQQPLGNGRHRVNCTAPHRNGSPFYWLSQQWLVMAE